MCECVASHLSLLATGRNEIFVVLNTCQCIWSSVRSRRKLECEEKVRKFPIYQKLDWKNWIFSEIESEKNWLKLEPFSLYHISIRFYVCSQISFHLFKRENFIFDLKFNILIKTSGFFGLLHPTYGLSNHCTFLKKISNIVKISAHAMRYIFSNYELNA